MASIACSPKLILSVASANQYQVDEVLATEINELFDKHLVKTNFAIFASKFDPQGNRIGTIWFGRVPAYKSVSDLKKNWGCDSEMEYRFGLLNYKNQRVALRRIIALCVTAIEENIPEICINNEDVANLGLSVTSIEAIQETIAEHRRALQ